LVLPIARFLPPFKFLPYDFTWTVIAFFKGPIFENFDDYRVLWTASA